MKWSESDDVNHKGNEMEGEGAKITMETIKGTKWMMKERK